MRAGGRPSVTDLDEDAVPLIVILAVTVRLLQQRLRVTDLTADAAARHRLEVGARSQRFRAELLHIDKHRQSRMSKRSFKQRSGDTWEAGGCTDLSAVFGNGCTKWVLAVVLGSSHDGEQAGTGHPVSLHDHFDLDDFGSTVCDGARLIKHD